MPRQDKIVKVERVPLQVDKPSGGWQVVDEPGPVPPLTKVERHTYESGEEKFVLKEERPDDKPTASA